MRRATATRGAVLAARAPRRDSESAKKAPPVCLGQSFDMGFYTAARSGRDPQLDAARSVWRAVVEWETHPSSALTIIAHNVELVNSSGTHFFGGRRALRHATGSALTAQPASAHCAAAGLAVPASLSVGVALRHGSHRSRWSLLAAAALGRERPRQEALHAAAGERALRSAGGLPRREALAKQNAHFV